jgi:hypothetical protein
MEIASNMAKEVQILGRNYCRLQKRGQTQISQQLLIQILERAHHVSGGKQVAEAQHESAEQPTFSRRLRRS